MRRRELLGLSVPVLAGVAGCLGSGDGDGGGGSDGGNRTDASTATATDTQTESPTTTGSPTRTTTGDPTPTRTPTTTETPSDVALSVTVERLQPAIRYLNTDAIGVSRGTNRQYLFLQLSTSAGKPPSRSDLAFRFDGTTHPPFEADRADDLYRLYHESESRYDGESGSGWILFELPDTGDAGDAALVWNGGEWRPDEGLRSRLAAPSPTLSVEWSVPDPVAVGSSPGIELSVTNEGDHPGRFVGALNRQDWEYAYIPLTTIDRSIPAGQTETWTVVDDNGIDPDGNGTPGDGEPDVTYDLRWPGGRERTSVRVVEE